jgi:hypothetical protein
VLKYFFEALLSILLSTYPDVELLDHMIILFLFMFLKNCLNVFLNSIPFYITTNSAHSYLQLLLFVFNCSPPKECEVKPTVVLTCISSMTTDTKHLFICFLAVCMFSLGKHIFQVFCPGLNWLFRVLLLSLTIFSSV